MKHTLLLFCLLLTGATGHTEERNDAGAKAGLPELRQAYLQSLEALLQSHLKEERYAEAAAVCEELGRLKGADRKMKVMAARRSPAGDWQWPGDAAATFRADGTVTHTENQGVWFWLGESRTVLRIQWNDGVVDTLTLTPDGKTLAGSNNRGEAFTAHRAASQGRVKRVTVK